MATHHFILLADLLVDIPRPGPKTKKVSYKLGELKDPLTANRFAELVDDEMGHSLL